MDVLNGLDEIDLAEDRVRIIGLFDLYGDELHGSSSFLRK